MILLILPLNIETVTSMFNLRVNQYLDKGKSSSGLSLEQHAQASELQKSLQQTYEILNQFTMTQNMCVNKEQLQVKKQASKSLSKVNSSQY